MKDRITVIGAGVIGGSVVRSLLKSKYQGMITVAEIMEEKGKELEVLGVSVTGDNRTASREADIIFLCVKPNIVKTVLKQIGKEAEGKLVISTAAAVTVKAISNIVAITGDTAFFLLRIIFPRVIIYQPSEFSFISIDFR